MPAIGTLEQVDVGGAQQQVFEHGVVGQQQVRRRGPHLGAAKQLVGQPGLTRIEHCELLRSLARRLGGVTNVAAEGEVGGMCQQLAEPLDLVVGERIHGVQQ